MPNAAPDEAAALLRWYLEIGVTDAVADAPADLTAAAKPPPAAEPPVGPRPSGAPATRSSGP